MELFPEVDFRAWLSSKHIQCSTHPHVGYELSFAREPHERAFWLLPRDPEQLARIAEALLDAVEPWSGLYLWPRDGHWPAPRGEWEPSQTVRDKIVRCSELTEEWKGAIYCSHAERSAVVALTTVHMLVAQCYWEDLFLVTESGHEIIYVDCEDAIHVECSSDVRLDAVVNSLKARGIHLPEDVPVTFKWPASMSRQYRKQ